MARQRSTYLAASRIRCMRDGGYLRERARLLRTQRRTPFAVFVIMLGFALQGSSAFEDALAEAFHAFALDGIREAIMEGVPVGTATMRVVASPSDASLSDRFTAAYRSMDDVRPNDSYTPLNLPTMLPPPPSTP